MTPNKTIEELVRTMRLKPRKQAHHGTLEAIRQGCRSPRALGSVKLGIKLAACAAAIAVIVLAGYIAFAPKATNEPAVVKPGVVQGQSLCEMLTARSLEGAFERGDMEALDAVFERANKLAGPRPVDSLARDVLADIDG